MLNGGLLHILEKVRLQKDFDFRQYKESILKRRIERRLSVTKAESYQQYTEVLDADHSEYTRLIDNLTIKVSEFFRNPQAWQILREKVLPDIIREKVKDGKSILRIWCAGCATGEEVYSVAMLAGQFLQEKNDFEVNIWGTDIDIESLLKAKRAQYKPDMTKAVPEDILNKYFDFDGNFRAKSCIRDCVYFKLHNLVQDEPLKQMDMIICRNVAIYFTRPLHTKIFMDFYNGLNDKGYLFLGKAETLIGPAKQKFNVIDKRWKIYQKGHS